MRFPFACISILMILTGRLVLGEDVDETKSVRKVEFLGGKVTRDEQQAEKPVIEVDFRGSKKISDKWLHVLKSFPQLKSLYLSSPQVTDVGMKEVSQLVSLRSLSLSGTNVTELKTSLPGLTISVLQ